MPKGTIVNVPLELDLPSVQPELPADTGRGKLVLTDIDAKLSDWGACEGQLAIDDSPETAGDPL